MKNKIGLRKAVSLAAASSIAVGAMMAVAPVAQAAPASAATALTTTPSNTSFCPSGNSEKDHPVLRNGDTGKPVKHLQCMLRLLGYSDVDEDGIFGSITEKAVRDWQEKHPYLGPVDGIVGEKTWASIHAGVKDRVG